MKRLALTVAALAALAVPASAANLNCEKDYKDFWNKTLSGPAKKMSGAEIAAMSRVALRGYDACTAGDERFTAKNFFQKLEQAGPAKAQDIFKQIEQSGPAKK